MLMLVFLYIVYSTNLKHIKLINYIHNEYDI